MKYRSIATPAPSPGLKIGGKKLVQPNQSMSLGEILDRFTRGEELPIGKDAQYHESDDDLEKIAKSDLVDRAEYVEHLEDTKKRYDVQEKARKKAEREAAHAKILEEERAKKAAEEAANRKVNP